MITILSAISHVIAFLSFVLSGNVWAAAWVGVSAVNLAALTAAEANIKTLENK